MPDETYPGAESVFSVANLAADHYLSQRLLSYRAHLWRLPRIEILTSTFHAELRRVSMGFDATLRVLDLAWPARMVRNTGPEVSTWNTERSAQNEHVDRIVSDIETASTTLQELDATGERDLTAVIEQLVTAGRHLGARPLSCKTTLCEGKTQNLVCKRIPTALDAHTERGARLWRKLVGAGFDTDWQYDLTLDDTVFQFNRGVGTDASGGITSLLTSEEAAELHAELRPIMPHVQDIYDDIEYERSEVELGHFIETVCGFALQCRGRDVLVYQISV